MGGSDLPLGVAEDDGLGDGQGVVQVTQGVELPLLPLHGNEELLDPLQGQLITEGAGSRAGQRDRHMQRERSWCQLWSERRSEVTRRHEGVADAPFDQDADGVGHELVGHLQDLVGQRGADQNHLGGRGQVAVHVVDLLLEPWTAQARDQRRLRAAAAMTPDLSPTFVEHLVGLVQDQHLDGSGPEAPAADHVCTHTKVTPEGQGHAPGPEATPPSDPAPSAHQTHVLGSLTPRAARSPAS